jgi:Recombinase
MAVEDAVTVVPRLYPALTAKYGTVTGLDSGNADLVRELFDRYAGGSESDRSLAIWLNGVRTRTAKGNPFSKDTVREMLVNSADAGFVGARRDKKFEIKDMHPPIVDLAVFERVQEIRSLRTRTLKPGRPTDGYVLSKLARCERCGAAMHGTKGGRNNIRRHYCAGRRQGARLCWLATAGTRRTSRRALREYAPTLGVLGF